MAVDLDVIVDVDMDLLPLGVDVVLGGQGLEDGLLKTLE